MSNNAAKPQHGDSGKPTWANERICLCGDTYRTMPPGPTLADHIEEVDLARLLMDSHNDYSRSHWDFLMYRHMARAVKAAGYSLT